MVSDGCEQLIWDFFANGGQVAIYDANNGTREVRHRLAEKFDKAGVHVIMLGKKTTPYYISLIDILNIKNAIETVCDNKEIIETNIRNVKISSPDVSIAITLVDVIIII